ncbi:uncharacterized protein LOC107424393 isoform X3 [Ziziphus jujuba]|uniref:Uncharacterized protein LOC107424393 isoform X3 n=1 Tax=Ziziphus jujuba TaxID=326968 RepID=A0ABM3ITG1_ZIZJJ|nr:uncharacterized protein LOC107424393 isoform X3 [Ziziphus jujuba]
MVTTSLLSSTQRYAAGALFAFALHQAQVHQTRLLGSFSGEEETTEDRTSSTSSSDSVADDPDLWVNENSGLIRHIFRFFEIPDSAWPGIVETAGVSEAKNHVGAFMRLLSEETDEGSSQSSDQELALSKAVGCLLLSMEENLESVKCKKEKHGEYEHECREKFSTAEVQSKIEAADVQSHLETQRGTDDNILGVKDESNTKIENPIEERDMLSYQRKVTVLYELLSACLADSNGDNKKSTRRRKGYDARHRVALRLLATWLDVKWIKMEAIETMVACSAMAIAKGEESNEEESKSSGKKWDKWKRGGIIGAAAITGGALLAITGGLAAPAISAGLTAMAPTLGSLIPVIGVSGFTAAATAAGTAAGSVAVAASFGAAGAGLTGTKMARRTGSVDEFEFKPLGENHNQGRLAVEILVSGFVFDQEDFVRPWEGQYDNSERYALHWESKNLIAVSTAIQDWLTSRIAMELMKQGAMMTVLNTLLLALAWPATLLAATDFIDSKWTIAVDRKF